MWKVAAGSVILAVLLTVCFFGHALATGLGVPYPDPTPEQKTYVQYHEAISNPLFGASALAWLFATICSLTCVVLWCVRRIRS